MREAFLFAGRDMCNHCTIIHDMVTVYRAHGWKITVYSREHGVPPLPY